MVLATALLVLSVLACGTSTSSPRPPSSPPPPPPSPLALEEVAVGTLGGEAPEPSHATDAAASSSSSSSSLSFSPRPRKMGSHIFVELEGVAFDVLDSEATIRHAMEEATKAGLFTALREPQLHSFEPHGVTGFILLAESHFSIHTWPEYGYAAVDIFTCGTTCRPDAALERFRELLSPTWMNVTRQDRGLRPPAGVGGMVGGPPRRAAAPPKRVA